MAVMSNASIKKAMKRVFTKIKPKKTVGVNPDQYLQPQRYPEGPSVWNQKSVWTTHHRRHL